MDEHESMEGESSESRVSVSVRSRTAYRKNQATGGNRQHTDYRPVGAGASTLQPQLHPGRGVGCGETADNHGCKNKGLTLATLDRLSPQMVTLQSLMSDWPPSTVDSGYEPSPQAGGDDRFTYPSDYTTSRRCDAALGETFSDFENSPKDNIGYKVRTQSLDCPDRKLAECCSSDDVNELNTPILSRLRVIEGKSSPSATPPITIPGKNIFINQQRYATQCDFDQSFEEREAYNVLNGNKNGNFTNAFEQNTANEMSQISTYKKDVDVDDSDEISNSDFRRPRAYSCPETCRPTPTRPPVPLYSSQTPGPSNLLVSEQSRTQFLHPFYEALGRIPPCPPLNADSISPIENGTESVSGYPANPPGGFVHSRNWSTPATCGKGQPLLLPSLPPAALKPAGSRDGIVDLSDDGPGHRRRVLVLSLPDVVVDSEQRGLTDRSPEHSRQGSSLSSSDYVPPLQDLLTQQVELRTRRRAAHRPRALSCDVTLEETVGRALRRIADEFEYGSKRNQNRSRTLLSRVRRSFRRSFTRMLIGQVASSDDEEQQGSSRRRTANQHRTGGGSSNAVSRQSSTASSSSPGDCCGYSDNDDLAFYDLEYVEGNVDGEPRYSLTRRGGDDFDYYL